MRRTGTSIDVPDGKLILRGKVMRVPGTSSTTPGFVKSLLLSWLLMVPGAGVSVAGSLFPNPVYPVPDGASSLALGDLNGDGLNDVVVTDPDSGVIDVRLGLPDGTLAPGFQLTAGECPTAVALGDLNGDGPLDLAVVNTSPDRVSVDSFPPSYVSIRLGSGDGTFGPEARYETGEGSGALGRFGWFNGRSGPVIVISDFDSDGRPDLAVANYGFEGVVDDVIWAPGDVSVLLGRGDGTFLPQIRSPALGHPVSLTTGDFNADGAMDIAAVGAITNVVDGSPTAGGLVVLLGVGDGSFVSVGGIETGFCPFSVAAGDFNGDGRLDLAVSNWSGQFTDASVDIEPGEVHLFLGRGDGSFTALAPLARGGHPLHLAVGDLNGDTVPDLVIFAQSGGTNKASINVLLGHGDGIFSPLISLSVADVSSLSVGNYDGDGHLDLAVLADGGAFILLGLGDGTFRVPPMVPLSENRSTIAIGDFNGDGRPDLVTGSWSSGELSFLPGLGDGGFGEASRLGNVPCAQSLASGDFNNDGALDVAVASDGWGFNVAVASDCTSAVFVFLGDRLGNFTLQTQSKFAGFGPSDLKAADFNGDGRLDLAVVNGFPNPLNEFVGAVSILVGRGDGSFGPDLAFRFPSFPSSFAIGDLNNDGVPDLAITSGPFAREEFQGVSILLGDGHGGFVWWARFAPKSYLSDVDIEDLDGDGNADLVVAVSLGYSYSGILWGRGDGTFGPLAPLLAESPFALSDAVADLNSDGYLDVVRSNSGTISVFLGHGDRTFEPEMRFLASGAPSFLLTADLNSDRRPDLVVLPSGNSFMRWIGDSFMVLLNGGPFPNRPPVAQAGLAASVECVSKEGGSITMDGSASTDPDSSPGTNDDIVSFEWFEDFGQPTQTLLGTIAKLSITLPLGKHPIVLEVTDKHGALSTQQVAVSVMDTTPPALVCPRVAPVECSAPGSAPANLVATATDSCGPTVKITNSRTAAGPDASSVYPLGTTPVTFTATDASGNVSSCTMAITVQDTTAPSLTLALSPTTLWPPNHKLVPVQATWQVSDVCDPTASVVLTSATSSDPNGTPGSGGATADIQDAAYGTPDSTVLLRAERTGNGSGRVYTLTYVATDAYGNSRTMTGLVTVPRDLGSSPVATPAKRHPGSRRPPPTAEPGKRP